MRIFKYFTNEAAEKGEVLGRDEPDAAPAAKPVREEINGN